MACDQLSNWLLILLLGSLFTQLTIVICCPINNLSPFLSLFVQLATVTCSQRVMACDQLFNWLLLLLLGSLFTHCHLLSNKSPFPISQIVCPTSYCDLFPTSHGSYQLSNWLLIQLLGSLFTQLHIDICCPTNQLSLFLGHSL